MSIIRDIIQILIIFSLFSISFLPIISNNNISESGAPDGSGVTNVTWYIYSEDNLKYENRTFWTKDIQVNSSGRLTWSNISAFINGSVLIGSGAMFNVSNCFINLSGDLNISGLVNFNNVTLVMNSTIDGEFGINVSTTGTFNVLNNSNITAFNTTAPINILNGYSGPESWGLHYYFLVNGNIEINNSEVSYTYGNRNYLGGIHLYDTSTASITNSTLYNNEISAIFAEGNTKHLIQNNKIMNASTYGIYLFDGADAIVDNNTIETGLDNHGFGIYCDEHCDPIIVRNTIINNFFDGIFLYNFSNATILNNVINNNSRVGIVILGTMFSVTGTTIEYTICNPTIENNRISNNFEWGIYNRISPMELKNNTISFTRNSSGVLVSNPYYLLPNTPLGLNIPGNITDNIIHNNNLHGINLSCLESSSYRGVITMDVRNNTVKNNNASGIHVHGGLDNQNTQRSPNPDITLNDLWNNNHSGILNTYTLGYDCWQNNINWNSIAGISCVSQSRPDIYENNISENLQHGIRSLSSTPYIHENNIFNNSYSGIYGQGGNNNFRITNNEINNNSWSGVECNSSSCSIQNNNITYNLQNGVKLSRGAGTLEQDNQIMYNNWNGLALYRNAQPILTNCSFNNNIMNGIYLDGANPRTGALEITASYNGKNGVYCTGGSGGMINGQITSNTFSGVFTTGTGTNTIFINSNISTNNEHGVNATASSAPEITNSTIGDDNTFAFWLSGSADPVCVNSTIPNSNSYFLDSASILTVKWFVHVRTISDFDSSPISDAKIWINSSTQSGANPVWTGNSNINGQLNWLRITEYTENKAGKASYSPYDITGDAYNYRTTTVTPQPTIDTSQTVIIRLQPNRPPSKVTSITPTSTHNPHPTIKWSPATDPDVGHLIKYQVWISNVQNHSIAEYQSQILTDTSYSLATDLDYDEFDGNRTYHITVVSTDGHGGASYSFQTMDLLNHKPTKPQINLSIPEKPNELMETVTCTITVPSTDPDGDMINYTYEWFKNEQKQSMLTESGTQNLENEISVKSDGISFVKGDYWEIRVYAHDSLPYGKGPIQKASFSIGNVGPTVNEIIEDVVIDEDTSFKGKIDLKNAFNDIDEQPAGLKYFITVSDENLIVTENKQNHLVDIEPVENWNGVATINFTCVDGAGLWATQNIKVTVRPVNDLPVFTSMRGIPWSPGKVLLFSDDKSATEEKWYNFTISGSDKDLELGENEEVSFKVSNPDKIELNQWQTNPLNATLSFYPTNDDVGIFSFDISIKDSSLQNYIHYTTIEIMVKNANDVPKIVSITELKSEETFYFPENNILDLIKTIDIKENEITEFEITAFDPDIENDDDLLTFTTDSVDVVRLNTDTGDPETAKVIIAPGDFHIGFYTFNITVKDETLERDTVQIKIRILNVNDPPVTIIDQPSIPDKIYSPHDIITFEGTANDNDLNYGDILTYTWTSNKDGDFGYNDVIQYSNLSIGEHLITFSAKDLDGDMNYSTINIIIGGFDDDNDNLPDEWERRHFDGLSKQNKSDDPDNDGYTNLQEYLGDSDPNDENDPEKQSDEESTDMAAFFAIAVIVVAIVILVLFLFFFLRKQRKEKPPKIKDLKQITSPGPGAIGGITTTQQNGASFDVQPPQDQGGPGVTSTAETQTQPQPTTTTPPQPQVPQQPFVPQAVTSCPKCNMVMTFSPKGGMFCINCGYNPEN